MSTRAPTTARRPLRTTNGPTTKAKRSEGRGQASEAARRLRVEQAKRARRRKVWARSAVVVGVAVVILLAVFLSGGKGSASKYTYAVGTPGPGAMAPAVTLPSTSGGTFSLAGAQGKTVLLYFQEGTDCEPCWTQMKAIQHDMAKFQALGIDEVVSVTTDPMGALQQKASDEGVTIPVLSDPNLSVSQAYNANQYGMMGTMMDGHSFLVVGPSGMIEWRADYGGAPNYTMYVPDSVLLKQMRTGLAHQPAS